MRQFAWLFVIFCLTLSLAAAEKVRVWTYGQGRTIEAQFVREVDGDAVFLQGGKIVTIPLDQLSEPDRKLIGELTSGKQTAVGDDASEVDPFRRPIQPADAAPPVDSTASRLPSLVKTKTAIISRDWTDLNGNRTSGKFVRVYDRVVLIMRGLRTVDLPFDTLSREDQDYVNLILTERGEQPLAAILAARGEGLNAGDLPAPRLAPAANSADSPSSEQGPAAQPGTSPFFQELRRRQEERRKEQAEHAAEAATAEAAQPPAENASEQPEQSAEAPMDPTSPPKAASGSGDSVKASRISTPGIVIDAKSLAELRPVLLVGLVVMGLFAAVGIVVYISTSIAGANSARRNRDYS